MPLPEIIAGLCVVEERVSGIKKAHNLPPNTPEPTPCFMNISSDGDIKTPRMMGLREWTHRISAMALFPFNADIADLERIARPVINGFITELDHDKTLGRTAGVISADVVHYRKDQVVFRGADGTEVSYSGVIFSVEVMEHEMVVYA